jgi:thiol-disulfide isomerase/thioredoxin
MKFRMGGGISRKWMVVGVLFVIAVAVVFVNRGFFEGFTSGGIDLADNTANFVMFKADWCGFCKKAAPKWEEVSSELDGKKVSRYNVKFVLLDESANKDDFAKYGIKAFPTFMLITKDSKKPYEGELEVAAVKSFLEANL